MNHQEDEKALFESREGAVPVVHAREVAAVIESMGYTDRSAKAWGFPDIFSLADHLFARLRQNSLPDERTRQKGERFSLRAETSCVLRKISLGLAYAVPWMVMLTLEYSRPDALRVSPEIGGALSLSLIASLITSGGYVQMISRSGNFYYGLNEPVLAHRICLSLLNIGLTSSLFLTLVGMIAGSYFHLFASNYLVLAAINYLALSILWMLCAVLSTQGNSWCIPFIFFLSILAGCLIKILINPRSTILLVLCPLLAVACALGCVLAGAHHAESKHPKSKESTPPRRGVVLISLISFYIYGTLYFSFLFADRLAAGSAVPWVSGLSFGIDAAYKQATDMVLLAFLITAALVEYLADSFLRFWQRLAWEMPQTASEQLRVCLWKRHSKMMAAILTAFVVIALSAWFTFSRANSLAPAPRLLPTAILGGIGYLILSVALLEIIILASANAISVASFAVGVGVAVNLLTGYGFSHLWGVQYAATGLLAGSAVVLWISNAAVRHVLRHADYHYSIS
ncbi:MAG TPA: hypothetical protein VE778_05290 [Candidatus Bathyarchaeia archaeon]|jgi:hypothetical protein|nr:hypothetical protein [Candidatus Bathyarchaeia archaeon]